VKIADNARMSQLLISNYIREIETLIRYGGSADESSIRKAFSNLLDAYCKPHDLRLIDELEYVTRTGGKIYPDGTIKDALRLTHGYWEAKDEADDLDEEIAKKHAKGYPTDNILFEDSKTAVLIQNDREVMRANMRDAAALDRLITSFVGFERPEVSDFRRAVEKFKDDLPKVLEALRGIPPEARDYKLGNRCALEWVLDQYKEKKPKDPTIREKFDTYRFADYKEKVIGLLRRVTTVSVETQRIMQAMKRAAR